MSKMLLNEDEVYSKNQNVRVSVILCTATNRTRVTSNGFEGSLAMYRCSARAMSYIDKRLILVCQKWAYQVAIYSGPR